MSDALFSYNFFFSGEATLSDAEIALGIADVMICNSHFEYTSGKHGDAYINKDRMYLFPELVALFSRLVAQTIDPSNIDIVCSPAVGGVALSQWVGYALRSSLGSYPRPLSVFADKEGGIGFVIRRGYETLIPGKRILIVEDIINDGKTVRDLVTLVRNKGGNVVAVRALFNRGGITSRDLGLAHDASFSSLFDLNMNKWPKDECPLCADRVPMNIRIGHGRSFVTLNPGYPVEK